MKRVLASLFTITLLIHLIFQLVKLGAFLALTHRTSRLMLMTLVAWCLAILFIVWSLRQTQLQQQAFWEEEQRQRVKIQAEIVFWEKYFALIPTSRVANRLSTLYQALDDTEKAEYFQQSSKSLFPPIE